MIDRLNAALEDRYQIDREVGEGGMATVFLADDLRHERKVALKVLKPDAPERNGDGSPSTSSAKRSSLRTRSGG